MQWHWMSGEENFWVFFGFGSNQVKWYFFLPSMAPQSPAPPTRRVHPFPCVLCPAKDIRMFSVIDL